MWEAILQLLEKGLPTILMVLGGGLALLSVLGPLGPWQPDKARLKQVRAVGISLLAIGIILWFFRGEPTCESPSIAGTWHSNLPTNPDYQINQERSRFRYSYSYQNETRRGCGLICARQVLIVEADNIRGCGWGTDLIDAKYNYGKVAEIDKEGRATRIEWDSGHFFHRELTLSGNGTTGRGLLLE